ncbi:MAG: 4-hydroxyacetophenone monooxygenase [Myxococcaceae bacterium]|nr:4-hydroxyacetophenone monooxygenase [Myxococcaceae bacterium]
MVEHKSPTHPKHVRVAIAGSGFGGLGTAIRLAQSGIDDFLVFERSNDVGGVWRDNTYPGCACDVESHLYSFSFARNPEWTRSFSPSKEIHGYLRACAERFGILPRVRFDHEIHAATWDDDAQRWRLETKHGVYTADVFVAAVGGLSEPAIPSLLGLETFAGTTFHSARWNHEHVLAGKRVAVIGTGASAIQFIPAIQPEVARLTIFQRTPPWIVPRKDRALTDRERRVLRSSKSAQWLLRARIYVLRELMALPFFDERIAKIAQKLAERHLARRVRNPRLREKLTPSYTMGCKRILLSDDYFPAVTKPNVDVVTDSIAEIRPEGILTKDGTLHAVDTIIFGTGFHVQKYPFAKRVHGKGGRSLAETWKDRMTAHLGTTVSGYPNLFLLQGPNTALGHTSVITILESQIEHVVNAVQHLAKEGLASVEPRIEAQQAFVDHVDAKIQGSVWTSGGCKSWYLDAQGRNSTLWPGFTFTFKRRVERFDPSEYVCMPRSSRTAQIEAPGVLATNVTKLEAAHG